METKKAIGRQGWWFAEVDGKPVPVAHKHWLTVYDYHDPFTRHGGEGREKKILEYVAAIDSGRQVILSNDDVTKNGEGDVTAFARTTYIAGYEVDRVSYSEADGLRFRLTKKLYYLKP